MEALCQCRPSGLGPCPVVVVARAHLALLHLGQLDGVKGLKQRTRRVAHTRLEDVFCAGHDLFFFFFFVVPALSCFPFPSTSTGLARRGCVFLCCSQCVYAGHVLARAEEQVLHQGHRLQDGCPLLCQLDVLGIVLLDEGRPVLGCPCPHRLGCAWWWHVQPHVGLGCLLKRLHVHCRGSVGRQRVVANGSVRGVGGLVLGLHEGV